MAILAIETATAHRAHAASIALRYEGEDYLRVLNEPNSQAARLVSEIEQLLDKQRLWYEHLSHVVFTVGPGSFTGIRIGLAVARSIAFACPQMLLVPVTTLEVLAGHGNHEDKEQRIILRAGKGEVYHQRFSYKENYWQAVDDIALCLPDEVPRDAPLIGNGMDGLSQEINAQTVLHALDKVKIEKHEAVPLYIRSPDAKISNKLPLA